MCVQNLKALLMFEPLQINDFLDPFERSVILDMHSANPDVIQKNTGPRVSMDMQHKVMDSIIQRLRNKFGEFELHNTQIFQVTYPHVLHNDWSKFDNGQGLAFLMPLQHNGMQDPKFIIYDQIVDNAAVKLFGGGPAPKRVHHNASLLEYDTVKGTVQESFDEDFYNEYLTHLKPNWVQGLSVRKVFDWTPGSLIVFHRCSIHSSSDFRNVGITEKTGLSVFTRYNECLD